MRNAHRPGHTIIDRFGSRLHSIMEMNFHYLVTILEVATQARVQRAGSRNVREQVLHLIG